MRHSPCSLPRQSRKTGVAEKRDATITGVPLLKHLPDARERCLGFGLRSSMSFDAITR
jgi:hypothetical protein